MKITVNRKEIGKCFRVLWALLVILIFIENCVFVPVISNRMQNTPGLKLNVKRQIPSDLVALRINASPTKNTSIDVAS